MRVRSARPPLYEKMRVRRGLVPTIETKKPVPPSPSPVESADSWFSPGRRLRIPVGYLPLAAATVLLLLIASYMVGHHRGHSKAQLAFEKEIISSTHVPMEDPLISLDSTGPAERVTAGETEDVASVQTRARRSWGPVVPSRGEDPRQNGLSYFVLAETTESGARRLAEFCRREGLEAYVVSGKNERLRRVIALPGFEPSARTTPQVKALESMIYRIGDQWKRQEHGTTDLRDAYPSLYTG